MKRFIVAVVALLMLSSVHSDAASDATRVWGLDFGTNSSLAASAANHARIRYNSSTGKAELSLNTGSYAAIVTTPAPATVAEVVSTVASVTTGEIDAQSYTLPANSMTTDGQKIVFDAAFTHAANTNSSTWKFYVAGNALFTTARTVASENESVTVTCVRKSSTILRCQGLSVSGTTVAGASNGFTVDYTTTIIFKTAVLGPTTNGDMTSFFLRGELWP